MYRPSIWGMALALGLCAALSSCRVESSRVANGPPPSPSASQPTGGAAAPTDPGAETMSSQIGSQKNAPIADRRISASGHDLTPPSAAEIEAREAQLGPLARRVLRNEGTERSHTSDLLHEKRAGVFICKFCGLPLFASGTKFKSGTGWPSYFRPIDPEHIAEHRDTKLGYPRTEVECARCESHMGHVFDDAPQTPTGLRYCINGVALEFLPADAEIPARSRPVAAPQDTKKSNDR
jgi:peptide-methionine (R)-S-oxide reductase